MQWKSLEVYNYLAMLGKCSSNCILMAPAKVLIKLVISGLGLGRDGEILACHCKCMAG